MAFEPAIIRKSYWKFIEDEAKAIKSDGCTGVSEWHQPCCFEHDLACYWKKDPRSAYAFYTAEENGPYWSMAAPMSRREADYMFAVCNFQWSPTKGGKVRSAVRFLGVRLGALLGIGKRQPKVD